MHGNLSAQNEQKTLPSLVNKIERWAGLASTALAALGLTLTDVFKWLEDHPYLRLVTKLASIILLNVAVWFFCSYVYRAKRTFESNLRLRDKVSVPKYSKRAKLTVTLLTLPCSLISLFWMYYPVQAFLADKTKIIILVAKFDNPKEDEQKVTNHIYDRVLNAVRDIPSVEVRTVSEVIKTKAEGQAKGEARSARIVLWGWYDNELAGIVHVEFLQKSTDFSLSNDQRLFGGTGRGERGFDVKQRISGEMSYLSLLVIGLAEVEIKDYDGAIGTFTRALQYPSPETLISPSSLYFHRGHARQMKGMLELAIEDYGQTINLSPGDAVAYLSRGIAYRDRGKWSEAKLDFEKSLALTNDDNMREKARELLTDLTNLPRWRCPPLK